MTEHWPTSSVVVEGLIWGSSRLMPVRLLLLVMKMLLLVSLWRQDAAPATVTSHSTATERRQPHLQCIK